VDGVATGLVELVLRKVVREHERRDGAPGWRRKSATSGEFWRRVVVDALLAGEGARIELTTTLSGIM